MIDELLSALFFIFMAEMGDKTQILAMTFATQYSTSKVLLGVLIGSFLNHGIAIILGSYLSSFIPLNTIQIIAGVAFVGFGLWALKHEDNEEETVNRQFNPIITVAMAFFIGELGDKTQLTAMTLATDAVYPFFILLGTVSGMIITSGIGIFIGRKVGEKIPELAIKLVSSAVFIFFGSQKLLQTVPSEYLTSFNISVYFLVLIISIFILLRPILQAKNHKNTTALKEVAATLYIQAHKMKKAVNEICLGEDKCGFCEGRSCLIGFARKALEQAENEEYFLSPDWSILPKKNNEKSFDNEKIAQALGMLMNHMLTIGRFYSENYVVNKAREALEVIAFRKALPLPNSLEEYYTEMKKIDKELAKKVRKNILIRMKEK